MIELLAVVAIAGVLIGLAFPVVARVRGAAMSATCQTHLRQLGAASLLYLVDHGNVMYPHINGGHLWYDYLRPYVPKATVGDGATLRESLYCPLILDAKPTVGIATGFGKNGNLGKTQTGYTKHINGAYPTDRVVLMWDDVQTLPSSYVDGGWPTATFAGGAGSWYKLAFRHQGCAHILLLDGHVSSLREKGSGSASEYPEWLWGPFDHYPNVPLSPP